jgi:competence protein ComEA
MLRTTLTILALCTAIVAQPHAAAQKPAAAATTAVPSMAVVNINTASAKELEGLPGIGQKTAARIVEFRQKKGPFKKIEDLMNVEGVGEKSFLRLKAQLTVAAKPETAKQ